MSRRLIWRFSAIVILIYGVIFNIAPAFAESLQSANYVIDESSIGTSDTSDSSSINYQTSTATGALSVGDAASASYQIKTGTKTTGDPALAFVVNNGSLNFDSFNPTSATVATANFSVTNYTSYGYIVQILGTTPTNGSHVIPAMGENDISKPGTEQFGINLVANTDPVSVGANPNNGQFGFGEAAINYNTSNSYRFVNGETIARAPKSSGTTVYTISYLVNVANLTPGGQYTSRQTLVVTGTY